MIQQGLILGKLLFNVFVNDIFYFINKGDLYNYADDKTLSHHSHNFSEAIDVFHKESKILIDWFHFNCMQDNPDKFQAIAVGGKNNPLYLILDMQIFHSGLRTVGGFLHAIS